MINAITAMALCIAHPILCLYIAKQNDAKEPNIAELRKIVVMIAYFLLIYLIIYIKGMA